MKKIIINIITTIFTLMPVIVGGYSMFLELSKKASTTIQFFAGLFSICFGFYWFWLVWSITKGRLTQNK